MALTWRQDFVYAGARQLRSLIRGPMPETISASPSSFKDWKLFWLVRWKPVGTVTLVSGGCTRMGPFGHGLVSQPCRTRASAMSIIIIRTGVLTLTFAR